MKNLITFSLCIISIGAFAQMQINKPIQLSGSGTDARIEGIQDVSANDHAANKIYVDTTIANNLSGGATYSVGDAALGGVVFYVNSAGTHGLVAAAQDQSASGNFLDAQDAVSNPSNHDVAGQAYTDWRMPTKYELNVMYGQKATIGGFANTTYWSATLRAADWNDAWGQNFSTGSQLVSNGKNEPWAARAIRAF